MTDIGTPMSGTVPVVGTAGTSYASRITAFLEEVKDRLEARIPISAILIGALDLANNAISNVSSLLLYDTGSPPTIPVSSLQNYNGDLYWVSPSGTAQITDGDELNASGVGGITGDYGGVNPAQLRFDDGDETYLFYDDFGGLDWAFTRQQGVEITGGETSVVRARIDWAGTSSYDVTLPADPPAAQAIVQMEADGDLVASNIMAVNQHITLSGTGRFKHSDANRTQLPVAATATSGTYSVGVAGNAVSYTLSTGGGVVYIPVTGTNAGDRLKTIRLFGSAGVAPTINLYLQLDNVSAVIAYTGSGTLATGYVLSIDTPTVLDDADAEVYLLKITSGASTVVLNTLQHSYDRP